MAATMRARRIGAATSVSSCPRRWASACSWTRRRSASTLPCRGATTPPIPLTPPMPPAAPRAAVALRAPAVPRAAAHGTSRVNPSRLPPGKMASRSMSPPPPTSPAACRMPRTSPAHPPPGKATARRKMRICRRAKTRPKAAGGHAASRPGCAGPDRAQWPSTWPPSLPAVRPASIYRIAAASPSSASSGPLACRPLAGLARPGRCRCSR